MRILAEHHLALHDEKPNHVGTINVAFKPKDLVEKWAEVVKSMSESKYGRVPEFQVNGHVNCCFPYTETPLDYILPELFKNAARATIEAHADDDVLPPISVTISNNEIDFIIRISDRGGGIPHHLVDSVTQYHFSTANQWKDEAKSFSTVLSEPISSVSAPMHGFGFGLPTSKAYCEFLGGSLTIQSLQGIGTDVYLRLRHIDGKHESFRI